MSITFRCEKCHKNVKAPDDAAGRRGRCPHCGATSYIPAPVDDEDLIPLADDEDDQPTASQEEEAIRQREKELLHEMGREPGEPLDQREELTSEDLHHYVVNYCMDVFNANLERAEKTAADLKKFRYTAVEAVEDFETGRASEDALKSMPEELLQGFLRDLKERLRS